MNNLIRFLHARSHSKRTLFIILLFIAIVFGLLRFLPSSFTVFAATFGTTTIGSLWDTSATNGMTCNRYQARDTGTATSMSAYTGTVDSSTDHFAMAIYGDSGGNPANLIAQTTNGVLRPSAWNTLPITASVATGTYYWLCYNADASTSNDDTMAFSNGTTPAVWKTQTFGTWPSIFPTSGLTRWTANFSIYVTVSAVATPTPTPTLIPTVTPTRIPTSTPTPRPTATPTPTAVPTSVPLNWFGQPNWKFRKAITVDHTKVSGTQSNFPVLIKLTSDASLAANAQSDGDDIVFTSSDGLTKLSHEIESYSSSTGQLTAWVKIPTLSSAADTVIYMYYGNSGASNQQSLANVWDSNFKGVWHLDENPSSIAPQIMDSTTNNNHGTSNGSMTPANQVAGKVSGSLGFDNIDDWINLQNNSSLQLQTPFTVSAWINVNALSGSGTGYESIVQSDDKNTLYYGYWLEYSTITRLPKITFGDGGVSAAANLRCKIGSTALASNTWYYVAATVRGPTDMSLYVNGVDDGGTYDGTGGSIIPYSSAPARISSPEDAFNGKIDEVRISNNSRSASWIYTEYNNQSSPSTFITVGATVPYPTSAPTIPAQPTPTPIPTYTISGTVFNDLNKDGNQDSGEPSFSNNTVTLSGPQVVVEITDVAGKYSFSNLLAGTYTISVSLPPNSKAITPASVQVVKPGGSSTVNFAMITQHTISGKAFTDFNANGTIETGETPFQNVTIKLNTDPFTTELTVNTDANGNFSFPNIQGGIDYVISAVNPTGFRSTNPNSINFTLNNSLAFNFGFRQAISNTTPGSCSGNAANIVLVMDDSGSMQDINPRTGKKKSEEARAAAINFVRIMQDNQPTTKMSLVKFAGAQNYPNDPTRTKIVVKMTNNLNQVVTGLQGLKFEASGTCHSCGLDMANKELNDNNDPNRDNYIIMLTDGRTNHSHLTSPYIQVGFATAENDAMKTAISGVNSHNAVIHTIGFGNFTTTEEQFLVHIANANGGVYRNDPRFSDVKTIYESLAALSFNIGQIRGFVFHDKNINGIYDAGDVPLPNWAIQATSPSITNTIQTATDSSGNYTLRGLCTAKYTVTQIVPPPWLPTTVSSYTVGVTSGEVYSGFNFGNRYGYTITGVVFDDINKNHIKDTGDYNYIDGPISITSSGGKVETFPDGSYKVSELYPGTYIISYTSLPAGYLLIYPKNGPPPSFLARIGPGCSVDGASGGTCDANLNIVNLNFAISDSIPWMQGYDLDMRFDDGLTNIVPKAPAYPQFVSTVTSASTLPGVFFSGDGFTDFGKGQVSNTGWQVGGAIYPEVANMSAANARKTSYTYLVQKVTQTGVTTTDLFAVYPSCKPTKCTIPASMPSGVYTVNGDIVLDNFNVPANRNIILLVNGNITIATPLQSQNGSTLIISSSGNITVDRNVGATPGSPLPAGQIQGFFSADRNFVIDGANDCLVGADKMLNIEGSIIVNAAGGGGKIINKRDLCGANPLFPSYTVKGRADFILNASPFLMDQITIYSEVAP